MSKPRKLSVICIDDENELSADQLGRFFVVHNLSSAIAVQRALLSENAARLPLWADLILCDINMEEALELRDGALADVFWGAGDVRPYGVLLALPFLGRSGLTTFIPYSSVWGTVAVNSNGYVLVALSMIQALSTGKSLDLQETRESIVSARTVDSLAQVPVEALRKGLAKLRQRIEDDGAVQLVDVGWTLDRLAELEQRVQESGTWPVEVPLLDVEGPLAVGVAWPGASVEFIEIGSLFADVLGYGPSNRTDIQRIATILRRWKANKGSVESRGDTLFEAAKEAFRKCDADEDEHVRVQDAVRDSNYVTSGGDLHQLTRTIMLFAWVEAWQTHGSNAARNVLVHCVHERLGLTGPNATNDYKGLLGKGRKVSATSGARRGFRPTATGVEAYSLEDDTCAAGLDANDRDLCVRFAEEELDWDNSPESAYPRWMLS